jgi:hypothetical protein
VAVVDVDALAEHVLNPLHVPAQHLFRRTLQPLAIDAQEVMVAGAVIDLEVVAQAIYAHETPLPLDPIAPADRRVADQASVVAEADQI